MNVNGTAVVPTPEQFEMRDLVERLRIEEMPLTPEQFRALHPFVEIVRSEVIETDGPPRRMSRTDYYRLNERGLKLLHRWKRGGLDALVR